MLFDSTEALKIRKHYNELLTGRTFEGGKEYNVTCVLIAEKGKPTKSFEMYWNSGGDENEVRVRSNGEEKDLEIYVYCDCGTLLFSELDSYLTHNQIEKIYDVHQN
jgi:hypothetical protein